MSLRANPGFSPGASGPSARGGTTLATFDADSGNPSVSSNALQGGTDAIVVPLDERGVQSIDPNIPIFTPAGLRPIPASTLAASPWLRYVPRAAKRDYLPLVTGKKNHDKCFGCWENKIACVDLENKETCAYCYGFGGRCNAGRRAPRYRVPAFKELYHKLQAEVIRRAKGQWQPISTEPKQWVDKVSMDSFKALFAKYGVTMPASVHVDRRGVLHMSSGTREESEDSVQLGATGRRKRRRKAIVPSSSPSSSSSEEGPSPSEPRIPPSVEVTPSTARPVSTPVLHNTLHTFSADDVNALIFPNQSISLTAADLAEEEERIVRLQEMLVPALRKKFALLQTLKAFNADADTTLVDRRLPLLDYEALDEFEREQSGNHRAGSVETKMGPAIETASEQLKSHQRTYDEATGPIDLASVPPWRRPESRALPLGVRLLNSTCF